MSSQSTNDFERLCKKNISILEQIIEKIYSDYEEKVKFNKEHADEILEELSVYGSWMSYEDPTSDNQWHPSERKRLEQNSKEARRWRMVLQDATNQSPQLDLSNLNITSFPNEICALSYLTSLNISGNKILELPIEIRSLVNLTEFDLSGNQLTFLPAEIGNLTSLLHLNLSNNQLTILPPTISRLSHLTSLDLSGNKFELLPDEIGELVNLKVLKA